MASLPVIKKKYIDIIWKVDIIFNKIEDGTVICSHELLQKLSAVNQVATQHHYCLVTCLRAVYRLDSSAWRPKYRQSPVSGIDSRHDF